MYPTTTPSCCKVKCGIKQVVIISFKRIVHTVTPSFSIFLIQTKILLWNKLNDQEYSIAHYVSMDWHTMMRPINIWAPLPQHEKMQWVLKRNKSTYIGLHLEFLWWSLDTRTLYQSPSPKHGLLGLQGYLPTLPKSSSNHTTLVRLFDLVTKS